MTFRLVSHSGLYNVLLMLMIFLSCGLIITGVTEFGNKVHSIWMRSGLRQIDSMMIAFAYSLFYLLVGCVFAHVSYLSLVDSILKEYRYHRARDPDFEVAVRVEI